MLTALLLSLPWAGAAQNQNDKPQHQHDQMPMPMPPQPGTAQPTLPNPEPPLAMQFVSGTAWEPEATPHFGWMQMHGGWTLMEHASVFLTFDREGGRRSVGKLESMNLGMLMQERPVAGGQLLFREMLSAESLTAPHGGFPELFQTGETYHGRPLVDRQHPHDVFGELSLTYLRPLSNDALRWYIYAAPAGEPALGPVAYVHRGSAAELPQAPLGHHLQDSTHISYGVLTGGMIFGQEWNTDARMPVLRIEASAFNGREPDERRYTLDFAPLDSWSARASLRLLDNWSAQYSFGHLVKPEAAEPGNLTRQTASLHYTRPLAQGDWVNSLIWGRNQKTTTASPQNSYLAESLLHYRRESLFTRIELVDKDELFPSGETYPPTQSPATLALTGRQFRIAAFTFGGVHDVLRNAGFGINLGLGADVTFYAKPPALDAIYGARPVSLQLFVRLRPAAMHMH